MKAKWLIITAPRLGQLSYTCHILDLELLFWRIQEIKLTREGNTVNLLSLPVPSFCHSVSLRVNVFCCSHEKWRYKGYVFVLSRNLLTLVTLITNNCKVSKQSGQIIRNPIICCCADTIFVNSDDDGLQRGQKISIKENRTTSSYKFLRSIPMAWSDRRVKQTGNQITGNPIHLHLSSTSTKQGQKIQLFICHLSGLLMVFNLMQFRYRRIIITRRRKWSPLCSLALLCGSCLLLHRVST